jgi:hypothetical protein
MLTKVKVFASVVSVSDVEILLIRTAQSAYTKQLADRYEASQFSVCFQYSFRQDQPK